MRPNRVVRCGLQVALLICGSACGESARPLAAPRAPSGSEAASAPAADLYAFAASATQLFIGAGDIASCDEQGDEETALMLDRAVAVAPTAVVFTAGDNAYPVGDTADFRDCYAPTWGRHKARTFPAIGNHDAYSDAGKPYHEYFGAAAGTYPEARATRTVGAWRVISLNSNCGDVDCGPDAAQAQWLKTQLEAFEGPAGKPTGACTVLVWHHPRASSGPHGDAEAMQPAWALAVAHRVELVLSGHDHHYERFGPLDAQAAPAAEGTVQVVVGTGGKEAYPVSRKRPGSLVQVSGIPALLALDLAPGAYRGRFAGADAKIRDAFEGRCR